MEGSPSDHNPLLLRPRIMQQARQTRRFRFENAIIKEPMCKHLIIDRWESSGAGIQKKIKFCGEKLYEWGKEVTSNFGGRIKSCKNEVKMLREKIDSQSQEQYKEEKSKLRNILEQREIFWRQRSKQL